MLESIDLAKSDIDKVEYKNKRDELMQRLIMIQQEAREKDLGIVVLFEGWDGAGKGSRISDMVYLLDARSTLVSHGTGVNSEDVELFTEMGNGTTGYYPLMQEFWNELGERGTMTIFDCGWYDKSEKHMLAVERAKYEMNAKRKAAGTRAPLRKLVSNAFKSTDELSRSSMADRYLDSIESFERSLTDNGYIVIKFFIHVSKSAQRKRLERLYNDPATSWRVSDEKMMHMSEYNDMYEMHDRMLERSNYTFAPWHLVNGEDKRAANLQIAQTLLSCIEEGLARKEAKKAAGKVEVPVPAFSRFTTMTDYPKVDELQHDLVLSMDEYKEQLKAEQKRFAELERQMYQARIPLIIMYEGWDAAGKGGSIKRVAQALDARAYRIYPSPAPTKVELAHPHLWRYWTRLPKAGHVGIYDRSWYGRVLVERLEGFATPEEVARAYDELNEYEYDLVKWGALVIKFWVDIDEDEQLKRFNDRMANPLKQWKITDEDWRNRDKNPEYREAIQDMFRLTSTTFAPWYILESNNKQYARVKALKVINELLEKRLAQGE